MISINFASKNYPLIARMHAGLVAGNVFLVIATAVIIWTALSLRADVSVMDKKLKALETAEEQVRPLLLEHDRVIKDLSSMSGLLESRRFSWTRLLTDVETVFPAGVALDRMEYKPQDHVLTLDGMAQSPESLRNLMVGLERSAWFREPYLKHQSVDKGSISFNVVASYQEHKAAGVAKRK
jgi:Tfp pilus assembly protein PilN